jgi:hypothetical protein
VRARLVNIALVAGSLLFSLIAIEVASRLYDGVRLFRATNFIRNHVDNFRITTYTVYDERLGWVITPNVRRGAFTNGFLDTDSHGIRLTGSGDRPMPQEGVLAVGDSFTFGDEVDGDQSWPAHLEAMLGVPVVNAATGGWGTDQIIMRAEDLIDVARPKTIILGYMWRDIERAEYQINFGVQKPYYTVEADQLRLHNVPVPRFKGVVSELGRARGLLGYSYAVYRFGLQLGLGEWFYRTYVQFKRATPAGAGERITCLLMKRLKERTGREHRLMLVMQYIHGDMAGPQPVSAVTVLTCARDLGLEVIDTWAPLAEIAAADPVRLRALYATHHGEPSHMSAAGNRLVAGEVARRLRGLDARP